MLSSMEGASGVNNSETIMKQPWPVKVGRVNSWLHALLRAVVILSWNEAGSEFCVLSSEFETGEKRETSGKGEMGEKGAIRRSKSRVRRSENSELRTQNFRSARLARNIIFRSLLCLIVLRPWPLL